MPRLPQPKTTKIILPSTKDDKDPAYVVIKDTVTVGDMIELKGDEGNLEAGIKMLTKLIVEWNFTDKNGKQLPVSVDNIKCLNAFDITYLLSEKLNLQNKVTLGSEKKSA